MNRPTPVKTDNFFLLIFRALRHRRVPIALRIASHNVILVALALVIYACVMGLQFKQAMHEQADALGESLTTQTATSATELLVSNDILSLNVLLPDDDSLYVIASDAGYGFVVKGEDLQAKNKAGKALLSLPNNAKVILPRPVEDREGNWLASVTTEGRLLVFKISDLPQLGKGKGNKIIGIPGERVASREEYVTDIAVIPEGSTLVLQAGKRTLSLRPDDLEHYKGERGRRGNKLPRGFQRVDALLVETPV